MLVIGHRGACGYEPENTLRSFKKALNLGVDMVEMDVHVTIDGRIVLMHDNLIDRTTNGKGNVFEKSFAELRRYDAGKGEKIPLLEEVFDLVNRKVPVNVELKGEDTAKPVAQLIKNYVKRRKWLYSDFLVTSFNQIELVKFKKLLPKVRIGPAISGIPNGYVAFAEKLGAYSITTSLDFINKKFVNDAHKRGIKMLVYTVNEIKDMKKMKRLGVDGIFTNYPDRARNV